MSSAVMSQPVGVICANTPVPSGGQLVLPLSVLGVRGWGVRPTPMLWSLMGRQGHSAKESESSIGALFWSESEERQGFASSKDVWVWACAPPDADHRAKSRGFYGSSWHCRAPVLCAYIQSEA